MKKVILVSALVLAFSGLALSDPIPACASGSLGSYVALGSTGCTVGNLLFYDFVVVPSPTSILNNVLDSGVTPLTTANNPGLAFNVGLPFAPPGGSQDVAIDYLVMVEAGPPITDSSIASVPSNGATFGEAECLGGSFSNGCTGGTQLSLTSNSSTPGDANTFSPTSSIGVNLDISSDDGVISNEQVNYSLGSSAVPEPASLTLFGIGLLGVAFLLRRKVFAEK